MKLKSLIIVMTSKNISLGISAVMAYLSLCTPLLYSQTSWDGNVATGAQPPALLDFVAPSVETQPSHEAGLAVDDIVVISNDGKAEVLKFSGQIAGYNIWPDRDVIELFTSSRGNTNHKCFSPGLGRLQKPFSIRDHYVTVTVPAHRTSVFLKGDCGSDGSPHAVQIDVKDYELGGIKRDGNGSESNKQKIFADYSALRQRTAERLTDFSHKIQAKDYAGARKAYSLIVESELYSEDLNILKNLLAQMPEDDQPIKTYDADVRFRVDTLNSMFGTNLDVLTKNEFLDFVKRFAATVAIAKKEGDETYLFHLMEEIGIPSETQMDVFIVAVETRINHFLSLGKQGESFRNIIWDDRYIVKKSLSLLGETWKGQKYVLALKSRLLDEFAAKPELQSFFMALGLRELVN